MIGSNAATTVAFFAAAASVAWSAAFAWSKWLAHRHDVPPRPGSAGGGADGARMARLEAAVEALAVELERLGEGQRHMARLLQERLPETLPPRRGESSAEPARITTPR